jgi:hypothetical protein
MKYVKERMSMRLSNVRYSADEGESSTERPVLR